MLCLHEKACKHIFVYCLRFFHQKATLFVFDAIRGCLSGNYAVFWRNGRRLFSLDGERRYPYSRIAEMRHRSPYMADMQIDIKIFFIVFSWL
jgi:hypothetical protein